MYLSDWAYVLSIYYCHEKMPGEAHWLQKTERYVKQTWTQSKIWNQARWAQSKTATSQLTYRNENVKNAWYYKSLFFFWKSLSFEAVYYAAVLWPQMTDQDAQPIWTCWSSSSSTWLPRPMNRPLCVLHSFLASAQSSHNCLPKQCSLHHHTAAHVLPLPLASHLLTQ